MKMCSNYITSNQWLIHIKGSDTCANNDCPLSNQCQITNTIYKIKITPNLQNYYGKINYGTREVHLNNDMETYYSIIKKLFYYKKHGKDTEV